MSLRFDTSKAPRTPRELHDLVSAVGQAAAEDEGEWIEWKSTLDLGAKETRVTLARHIIGMANRRTGEAARFAEGIGYILIGIEPGSRYGVSPVDFADLERGIYSYLGPHGPRWTASYDTDGGAPVLIIAVAPPQDGDPIQTLHKDFGNYRAGDIFVRKLASTEKADAGDLDYLAQRRVLQPTPAGTQNFAGTEMGAGASAISSTDDRQSRFVLLRRRKMLFLAGVIIVAAAGLSSARLIGSRAPRSPSNPAAASPSVQYVIQPESCGALQYGVDGTAGPVLCPDGRPNMRADEFYRKYRLKVLELGPYASPTNVRNAICADFVSGRTTNPIESDAAKLAQTEEQWNFGETFADGVDDASLCG